jgi:dienelactone hydrolase
MKHLYKLCTSCLLLACVWVQVGFAQTHTPIATRINSNCGGYYEYLPQGYNPAATQLYPLIVYIHGNGDRGPGTNKTALDSLLRNALPQYINNGLFPATFTAGGKLYRFIVLSPQFLNWPNASQIASVVDFAKTNYKVDSSRIYVTGMSMGGGVCWEYAGSNSIISHELAAIVPICGATTPNQTTSNNIALANLPVWATHNAVDYTVDVSITNTIVKQINEQSPVPPNPNAKKTIFQVQSHDAWTQTYNPSYRENGLNIYEWMLQYQRTEAALPVILTNYKILSAEKQGVTIGWTTTAELNNQYFSIERSTDGEHYSAIGKVNGTNLATGSNYSFTDSRPVTGNNFYRLTQTDMDGRTNYFGVLKTVIDYGRESSLVLFPNPATRFITVGFNHPDKDRLMVKILNPQGLVMQVNQYNKETGYWQQQINIAHLAAGQYFVQVKGALFESTQPLTIIQ